MRELAWTLLDTLETGDLPGHLVAWWEVVTGRVTPDDPAGSLTPTGALLAQEWAEPVILGGADERELAEV